MTDGMTSGMTAHAMAMPRRRGACPGLSAPMPTGDGLLVRLLPRGTIPLAAFAALSAAARAQGNGVIEITSRGSIQARGLSVDSAPKFAAAIAALDIAAEDGLTVHCNALAGIDAEEIFDADALAAMLRRTVTQQSMAAKFSAKTSVAIDGGGALGLAKLAADIRLGAQAVNGQAVNGNVVLRIGVGGDATSAAELGIIAPTHGIEAVMRLLEVLARYGRTARARDIVATEGAAVFRSAITDFLISADPSESGEHVLDSRWRGNGRKRSSSDEAISLHRLHGGLFACGIGLAFGHADARAFEALVDAAAAAGAKGLRTAPGRVLLAIGLQPETASAFAAAADRLGFVVRADDPRRHVLACAGAPFCASANIASRALAPLLAPLVTDQAARQLGGFTIHISGCAKGCARAAPAPLTIVGTPDGCALIAHGASRDAPFAVVPENELAMTIRKYLQSGNMGNREA